MLITRTFQTALFAILLVAVQAINTKATAQNSNKIGLNSNNISVLTTERVRAELMAHAPQGINIALGASADDKITPNTVWVGLQLAHQPHWHTYWKNAGDSGLPTKLTWTLPVGVMAGDIAWPAPQKIKIGSLMNFGYEGTVLLAVPLTITPSFKPSLLNSNLDIKLKAQWLICKQECIPEEGEFALSMPVKGSTAINTEAFEAAFKATPKPIIASVGGAMPLSSAVIEGNALKFEIQGLPVELRGKTLDFYPESPEVLENSAINESNKQEWVGAVWRTSLPLSAQRSQSPAVMPVVLKLANSTDGQAWRADVAVQGNWPKAVSVAAVSPGLATALAENKLAVQNANVTAAPVSLTLFAALLGALLGGLILNLMPCVFPVLALKVVGFTQHAGDAKAHRRSGVAYFAGVVLSFVALGALFLALRAAGEELGWGFQLQNPIVVAGLALLFTVLGLNLAGAFEFGSVLPSSIATARAKNPTVDSFLSGMLAVAIASPCTAPFMGASLGFALGLPAFEALLIFAAIGVGMALPYLAASFIPAVARVLPKPGAWMNTFKKLMAVPMFATVVWLIWVLGQQLPLFDTSSEAKAQVTSAELWQPWQPGSVDQILASGKPVFVDFTAAWCVTCQFNKKTTLSKSELLAEFEAKKVQLLRADWTRRDPAIGAALKDLGRSGVPVYVLYAPGKAPQVLSEIISVDDVKAALGKM